MLIAGNGIIIISLYICIVHSNLPRNPCMSPWPLDLACAVIKGGAICSAATNSARILWDHVRALSPARGARSESDEQHNQLTERRRNHALPLICVLRARARQAARATIGEGLQGNWRINRQWMNTSGIRCCCSPTPIRIQSFLRRIPPVPLSFSSSSIIKSARSLSPAERAAPGRAGVQLSCSCDACRAVEGFQLTWPYVRWNKLRDCTLVRVSDHPSFHILRNTSG